MIKILRDICLEQPTFNKVTEMCVRMIRRVNDEEGIKVGVLYEHFGFHLLWTCCDMFLLTSMKNTAFFSSQCVLTQHANVEKGCLHRE